MVRRGSGKPLYFFPFLFFSSGTGFLGLPAGGGDHGQEHEGPHPPLFPPLCVQRRREKRPFHGFHESLFLLHHERNRQAAGRVLPPFFFSLHFFLSLISSRL